MHSIGEIVKQFEFHVPQLRHAIKGKIVKSVSEDGEANYSWSISHHYQPAAGAGVYFPSHLTCPSLGEAEALFRAYAQSFVPNYKVTPNEDLLNVNVAAGASLSAA
jgi:hypothetical protein